MFGRLLVHIATLARVKCKLHSTQPPCILPSFLCYSLDWFGIPLGRILWNFYTCLDTELIDGWYSLDVESLLMWYRPGQAVCEVIGINRDENVIDCTLHPIVSGLSTRTLRAQACPNVMSDWANMRFCTKSAAKWAGARLIFHSISRKQTAEFINREEECTFTAQGNFFKTRSFTNEFTFKKRKDRSYTYQRPSRPFAFKPLILRCWSNIWLILPEFLCQVVTLYLIDWESLKGMKRVSIYFLGWSNWEWQNRWNVSSYIQILRQCREREHQMYTGLV